MLLFKMLLFGLTIFELEKTKRFIMNNGKISYYFFMNQTAIFHAIAIGLSLPGKYDFVIDPF